MKKIETIGKLMLVPAAILAFGLTTTAGLTGCGETVEDKAEDVIDAKKDLVEEKQELDKAVIDKKLDHDATITP